MPNHFFPELLPPPPPPPPSRAPPFARRKNKKAESSSSTTITLIDSSSETSLLPADDCAAFRSDNWHQSAVVKARSFQNSWTNEIVGGADQGTGGSSFSSSSSKKKKQFLSTNTLSRKSVERRKNSVNQPPSSTKNEANSIRNRWPPKTNDKAVAVVVPQSQPRYHHHDDETTAHEKIDVFWTVETFESRLSDIPDPKYHDKKKKEGKIDPFTSSSSSFIPILDDDDQAKLLADTHSERSVLRTAKHYNNNSTISKTSRRSGFLLAADESEKKHAAAANPKCVMAGEEQPEKKLRVPATAAHVAVRAASPAAKRIRQRMKQGNNKSKMQKQNDEVVTPLAKAQKNVSPATSKTGNHTMTKSTTRFTNNAMEYHANRKKKTTSASPTTRTNISNTNSVQSSAKPRFNSSVGGMKNKIEMSLPPTPIEDDNTHYAPVSPVIVMKKFEGSMLSQQISDIEGSTMSVHLVSSDSLTSLVSSDIGRIRSILFRNRSKPDNVHLVEAMESDFPVYTESSMDPMERASFRLLSATIVPIQCMVRKYQAKRSALLRLWAIITIQACARGKLARSHLKCMNQSANMIQARFRGNQVRDRIALENRCVVEIQRHVRGFLATMMKYVMLGSATMIQCAFRKYLAIEKAKDRFVSVILIQSAARGFLARAQLAAMSNAATIIQAGFRRFAGYFNYQIDRADIITVQCAWRKKLAIRKTNLRRWNKAATLIRSGLEMMGVECCSRELSPASHSLELAMPSQDMLMNIASLISSLRVPTE